MTTKRSSIAEFSRRLRALLSMYPLSLKPQGMGRIARPQRAYVACVSAVFWCACAGYSRIPGADPGLRIPHETLAANFETFCVDDVSNPLGIAADDARVLSFESAIADEIERQGFQVVESEPLNEAWGVGFRVQAEQAPIYDPHFGTADPERLEEARRSAFAELGKIGCDALVSPSIVSVTAGWGGGRVEWDGTHHQFSEGLNPGSGQYGTVGALSLRVRIHDLEGELIYFGTGGIEVMAKLVGGLLSDDFKAIDEATLLTDDQKRLRAIRLALEGLRKEPLDSKSRR